MAIPILSKESLRTAPSKCVWVCGMALGASLATWKGLGVAPSCIRCQGNYCHQFHIADINCIILFRKAANKAGAKSRNGNSHLVQKIIKDNYLKMCVGLWNGTGGLSGYMDRLLTCSKLQPSCSDQRYGPQCLQLLRLVRL